MHWGDETIAIELTRSTWLLKIFKAFFGLVTIAKLLVSCRKSRSCQMSWFKWDFSPLEKVAWEDVGIEFKSWSIFLPKAASGAI